MIPGRTPCSGEPSLSGGPQGLPQPSPGQYHPRRFYPYGYWVELAWVAWSVWVTGCPFRVAIEQADLDLIHRGSFGKRVVRRGR
jgi:hypothetical protein